jgi:cytochrome c oxidase accessory protein FixG
MINGVLTKGIGILATDAWPYFLTVISLLFYGDIAIFREQYCVYICPYARFQSVMLDNDSIVIAYDKHRGEPRRNSKGSTETTTVQTELITHKEGEGDCTNCNMCTLVCPTGIDIREGLQVSCINCGHCIDACDHEMAKFDKPSLVDFSSMNYFENRIKTRFFRIRTIIYLTIATLLVGAAVTLLINRKPIHFWVYPDPKIGSFYMSENIAQNYYKMDIGNITESDHDYVLEVRPMLENSPVVKLNVMTSGASSEDSIHVKGNALFKSSLVIQGEIDKSKLINNQRYIPIIFHVHDKNNPKIKIEKRASFVIPEK